MLVPKLQGSSSLSTFHAKYVYLSQTMRDLVYMKTVVNEVVNAVGQDTKRLYFSTQSTVSENNYGVVKVTQNHKLSTMTPGYNHTTIRYHWFREKIYIGGCSVQKVEGKDQKANIFTRVLHGEIFLHIRGLLCGWQIKPVKYQIYMSS